MTDRRNDKARGERAPAIKQQQTSRQSTDAGPVTPPLYAIVDRRRDGRRRIVAEYDDPKAAHDAALLMRWAGDAVDVVLVSQIRDDGSDQ